MNSYDIAAEACNHQGAMQRPHEFAQAIETVSAINPQITLEIGCASGGTLYAWSQICPEVYGITRWVPNPDAVLTHGATVLFADSHTRKARTWIENKLRGRELDMLFIDGDHSLAGSQADWDDYTPYVRKGGLVLIHDVANESGEPDVVRFWQALGRGTLICDAPDSILAVGFGIVEM